MRKIFSIWNSIYVVIILLILNSILYAQLTAPTTEAVYGGRINGISVISTGPNTSRIYISTESANSVFYADVTTTPSSESFGSFTVMPGLGNDDGYGSTISKLFAHALSGYLFFINNNNLYKTHYSSSTVTLIDGVGIKDMIIYGDYLFYIKDNSFNYAQIDASGNLTGTGNFAISSMTNPSIKVNTSNNKIYICDLTTSPSIYKSSDNYNALTGSSSFTSLTMGTLSGSVTNWAAFGIGPDGTLFLGGDNGSNKFVQYSVDDAATWSGGSTSLSGVSGSNFSFAGSSSPYIVYFGRGYSTYTNGSGFGSWSEFGNVSYETHPNDGAVFVDPNNSSIVYLTTDQGIGATKNGGSVIFEIDTGVEAVQVNDFSMNSTKDIAWLASKSGVRKVTNFSVSPTWSLAMFPNNDGSPYYSAEMENDNDATAYVGNVRVYKTTNSGSSWTQVLSEVTTGYPAVGTRVEAIEVCPTNSNLVLAGFYVDDTTQGGLWYSTDAGSTWSQLQLRSGSTLPNDVDVYDIVFTTESGNPVAYIGVYYDLNISSPSNRGYSVYRAEWNGSSWSTRQDMQASYTSTGTVIVVTIIDLEVTASGTKIYACGTDASINHPVAYYKDLAGTNLWTPVPVSGFPTGNQQGKAIANGGGYTYCAVDNVIYYIPDGGTSWSVGYTYPAGTQINVLFYDALLAGTGTGLYNFGGVLAVELVSLTASYIDNYVYLSWSTATETNNYGFEIESMPVDKNDDNSFSNWYKIGFVPGNGNSNSLKKYEFIDKHPRGSKMRYRLKQIDIDGSFEYSNEVDVDVIKPDKFLLYQNYPNPFNPSTTIQFAVSKKELVTLKVYDVLGNEVATLVNEYKEPGVYQVEFSLDKNSGLSSGVYIYKLTAGSTTLDRKKMILLK